MIVANGYTCFRSYVKEDATGEQENRSFVGKRIDVTQIPQYLKGSDRGDDVELWEIKYVLWCLFRIPFAVKNKSNVELIHITLNTMFIENKMKPQGTIIYLLKTVVERKK